MMPGLRGAGERLRASPVVRGWLLSRGIVILALIVARLTGRPRATLLAWDAAWYQDIADRGYAGASPGAVRFFPAWPLLTRGVSGGLAGLSAPSGAVLVVLASAAALLYLALAGRVAVAERLGGPVAERVPAVVALAPAGFVLVMGYAEALFGVLVCVVLLAARRGRWLQCGAAGLVAGALRPTGVLLCLSIAIEGYRSLRPATPAGVGARAIAAGAPAVGLGLFLAWTWLAYGDPLAPFHAQTGPGLRGGILVDPFHTLVTVLGSVRGGGLLTVGATHVLWIAVALALLVVCARRLPVSFTAFSAATLFLAVTASSFTSFERYACSALPLLLAAAVVLAEHPRVGRVVAVAAPLSLFGYALLAFSGWYVP